MALDANTLEAFECLAEGRLSDAKAAAERALRADESKKNVGHVARITSKMIESYSTEIAELPFVLEGMMRVEPSLDPELYVETAQDAALMAKLVRAVDSQAKLLEWGLPYRVAALIEGPPGCGKSQFARALGAKLGLPVFILDFAGLINSRVGQTAFNLRSAFEYAISRECVLFLDEFDCIAVRRKAQASGAGKELANVTMTLMQLLDRVPEGSVVVAATNRADTIDEALLRRFPIRAAFEPLSAGDLLEIVRRAVSKTPIDFDSQAEASAEIWCEAHAGGPASEAFDAALAGISACALEGVPFRMPAGVPR